MSKAMLVNINTNFKTDFEAMEGKGVRLTKFDLSLWWVIWIFGICDIRILNHISCIRYTFNIDALIYPLPQRDAFY